MPKQPRGKRIESADHEFAVVSKNSNGDGSVHFEPGRTEQSGRVRKGMWRATYRDGCGKIKRVSALTVVAETPAGCRRRPAVRPASRRSPLSSRKT
jgi:hypothetical protein